MCVRNLCAKYMMQLCDKLKKKTIYYRYIQTKSDLVQKYLPWLAQRPGVRDGDGPIIVDSR